jgi:hypothetical protein
MGNNKKSIVSSRMWQNSFYLIFIFLSFVGVLSFLNGGIKNNFKLLIISLIIFAITTIVSITFFSQFVLPVRQPKDRIQAASRLFSYILGKHGPAIFIENGQLRERKDEHLKNGPGVILLDTASAAVLRTPVNFKGAVGPGIAFLGSLDSIAGVVDLHIQTQKLGPRETENPFLVQQLKESDVSYFARKNRRLETQAITRDGIEVCSTISVDFKLDASQGMGNSEFGFNPQSVEKAIIGLSIDLTKSEDNPDKNVSWKWLPAQITVDLWREYLSKITFDELFPLSINDISQVDGILMQIKNRLTQPNYLLLDDYGHHLNESNFSKEYDLLRNRGIKVLSISISNFKFPKPIEDNLIDRWKSSWLDYAQKDQEIINKKRAFQAIDGKDQALMDYAYGTTSELGSVSPDIELSDFEILEMLLKSNQKIINQDSGLASVLNDEYADISRLIEWVNSEGKLL